MFQYGTESSIYWKVAKKVFEYMEILKKFHEDLIKNDAYQQNLTIPSSSSGQSILNSYYSTNK